MQSAASKAVRVFMIGAPRNDVTTVMPIRLSRQSDRQNVAVGREQRYYQRCETRVVEADGFVAAEAVRGFADALRIFKAFAHKLDCRVGEVGGNVAVGDEHRCTVVGGVEDGGPGR